MNKKQEQLEKPKRRPYEKPGFVSEKAFEIMALSCGSGVTTCLTVPPNS